MSYLSLPRKKLRDRRGERNERQSLSGVASAQTGNLSTVGDCFASLCFARNDILKVFKTFKV